MRIYTFYSDSHSALLNRCIESLKRIGETDVTIAKFPQVSQTGSFHSLGWHETMLRKLDYILYSVLARRPFIHADCDITFYEPFSQRLHDVLSQNKLDLLFQSDGDGVKCMGFFACKPSYRIFNLFASAKQLMINGVARDDQQAVNALLSSDQYSDLKVACIGPEAYSIWRQTNRRVWEPKDGVKPIDHKIFMHHANFTVGIDNKLILLDLVKKAVQQAS